MSQTTITPSDSTIETNTDVSRRDLVAKLLGVAGAGAALSVLAGCSSESRGAESNNGNIRDVAQALTGVPNYASSASALRAITGGSLGWVAILGGYYAEGDGGGGVFYWDTATAVDNGGTILNNNGLGGSAQAGWRRIHSGALDVRWFGVFPIPSTGDSAPGIQRAIDVAAQPGSADLVTGSVYIPAGEYHTQSTIVIPRKSPNTGGLTIRGDGAGASVIIADSLAETVPVIGFSAITSTSTYCAYLTLEGMSFQRNNRGLVLSYVGTGSARLNYATFRNLDFYAPDGAAAPEPSNSFSSQSCIYLRWADSCVFEKITVQGGEVALYMDMCARCTLTNLFVGSHLANSTLNCILVRGGGTHTFTDIFVGGGYWTGTPDDSANRAGAGLIIMTGLADDGTTVVPPVDIVVTNLSTEGLKSMSPCIDIRGGRHFTFINASVAAANNSGSFGVLIREGVAFVRFIGGYFEAPDNSQNVYILSGSTPDTQTSDIAFDGVQLDGNAPYGSIGISSPAKRVRMGFTLGNQTSGLARFARVSGVIESLAVDATTGVAHVAAADVWRVAASSFIKYLYDGYEGQVITLLLDSGVSFWASGNVALASPIPATYTSGTLSLIYDTTPASSPNTGTWREIARAII